MKSILLLIATLLFACFVYRAEAVLKTTYWYQGTVCTNVTPFLTTIRDSSTGCNVTQCVAYSAEPGVLSQSYECPNSYPNNPTLNSGEITIYTYTNSSCIENAITRYDIYKTNVCIKSSVIFGPGSKSGQYVGCDRIVTYLDENCQNVSSSVAVTLNSCSSGKINKCLSTRNSTSDASIAMNGQFSMLSMVLILILGLFVVALF